MAYGDEEGADRDDRTIYVGQLSNSDKMTEAILYELFFQAGPIERVSIPKDQDGRLKNFGFVTYKHLPSVSYALSIFSGTRLFGKELLLRNRNGNRSREQNNQHQSMSLVHGTSRSSVNLNDMSPTILQQQQQLIQQQLILLATGSNLQNYVDAGNHMFSNTPNLNDCFASTRSDLAGSYREHYVDRNRYHREENRSSRSKPYRRSRSRSPIQQNSQRNREKSPVSSRRHGGDRGAERSNYHRWGKR